MKKRGKKLLTEILCVTFCALALWGCGTKKDVETGTNDKVVSDNNEDDTKDKETTDNQQQDNAGDNTGDNSEDNAGGDEVIEEGVIYVKTAKELLDAIAPGAEIILEPGVYNLSGIMKRTTAVGNPEHVDILETYDGKEAVIMNVDGLIIRGKDGERTEIVVESRYADVLRFEGCSNIVLKNLVIGHTVEQGECAGEVLEFNNSTNIILNSLDLYGCGTYGINADHTQNLLMQDSVIRECSSGAINMNYCNGFLFQNCDVKNCEGYDLICVSACNMGFEDCKFYDNAPMEVMISDGNSSYISFDECSFGVTETQALAATIYDGGIVFKDNCKFSEAISRKIVTVKTTEELLNAIAPDTTIYIAPGYYNLSEYIENVWQQEGVDWNDKHPYAQLRDCFDGVELVIRNANGLALIGQGATNMDTQIVVEPRYATVFNIEDCTGIALANMSMGHTEYGDCTGNVLNIKDSYGIRLENMDIFGCGYIGIDVTGDTTGLYVYNSVIRDCSLAPIGIVAEYGQFVFVDCVLKDSFFGGYFENNGMAELAFYRCTFGQEESNTWYFVEDIITEDCNFEEITKYPEYGY